jgi:adenine phosphoribosyltransferase
MDYLTYIDDHTPGRRSDVTPLFANADAFRSAVDDLLEKTAALNWNIVAGVDALGFVIGGALAARRACGLVAIRKQAKLPVQALQEVYAHYSGGTEALELRDGLVKSTDRVLIVDEWIETGATVQAAVRLIERTGGCVVGIATIHCDLHPDRDPLLGRVPVVALRWGS